MQHQSNAHKQMLSNNYRLHKQRLSQIKSSNKNKNQNCTSLQFYSVNKSKLQDRKKLMLLQQRKQQIQNQNLILKNKINKIKGRDVRYISYEQDKEGRKISKDVKNKIQRYDNLNQQVNEQKNNPISICQQDGDIQVKCVIPAPCQNKKRYSYLLPKPVGLKGGNINNSIISSHNTQIQHKQQNTFVNKFSAQNQDNQLIGKNYSKDEYKSISHPRNSVHQLGSIPIATIQIRDPINNARDQVQYPQLAIDRVVLYKKTTLLSNTTSCLLQISVVNKKMLFMAYIMGAQNFTAKLFIDEARTKNLLMNCEGDFDVIASNVVIDRANKSIKVHGMANPNVQKDVYGLVMTSITDKVRKSLSTTNEQKYKIQQDFIKRNHFTRNRNNKTADPTHNNNNSINQSSAIQKIEYYSNRRNLNSSDQNNSNKNEQNLYKDRKNESSFIKRFYRYNKNSNHSNFEQQRQFNQFNKIDIKINKQQQQQISKQKCKVDIKMLANRLSDPNYGRKNKKLNQEINMSNNNKNIKGINFYSNNKIVQKSNLSSKKDLQKIKTNKNDSINLKSEKRNNSKIIQKNKINKINKIQIQQKQQQIIKSNQKQHKQQQQQQNQDDYIKNLDSQSNEQYEFDNNQKNQQQQKQLNNNNSNQYQQNYQEEDQFQQSSKIKNKKQFNLYQQQDYQHQDYQFQNIKNKTQNINQNKSHISNHSNNNQKSTHKHQQFQHYQQNYENQIIDQQQQSQQQKNKSNKNVSKDIKLQSYKEELLDENMNQYIQDLQQQYEDQQFQKV